MTKVEIIVEGKFSFIKEQIVDEVEKVVTEKGFKDENTEVVVSVVGNQKMKQLHKEYMVTDEVTDVLSFPLFDQPVNATKGKNRSSNNDKFLPDPDGVIRFGDVVICFPVAVKQAKQANRSVEEEMAFLAGHGCRHLLGEHHE